MKRLPLVFCTLLLFSAACASTPDAADPTPQQTPTETEESPPQAEEDSAEVPTGDFCDPQNIRQVVGDRGPDLRHCYERELQQSPEIYGRVDLNWHIELDGSTSSVNVTGSTMENEKVESCLVGVIEELQFAEPDGGLCEINYPLVFNFTRESPDDGE